MTAFKAGDRVVVRDVKTIGPLFKGQRGVVKHASDGEFYWLDLDNGRTDVFFWGYELEREPVQDTLAQAWAKGALAAMTHRLDHPFPDNPYL